MGSESWDGVRDRVSGTRRPSRPDRVSQRWARWASLSLVAVLLVGGLSGAAAAPRPHVTAARVLAITQSPMTVGETDTVTVSLQVNDTSNIQQIYFTFCQLTSSRCYLPVVMTPQASNWFVGTTEPMTAYPGMNPGVSAGYNITLLYTDNSTSFEPSVPNAFSNLTLATTVTGEYVFKVTVATPTYGLSGRVYDSASGSGVAGATVSLSPGNATAVTTDATGAYAFAPMPNGSYTIWVNRSGYLNSSLSVLITNASVVKDVGLTASAVPKAHTEPQSPFGFLSTPVGMLAIVALLVVVAVVVIALARRGRSRRGGPASPPSGSPPAGKA